ncbi:MAG: AAA family ATPase, partial [Acidimicrobiales bacterium]
PGALVLIDEASMATTPKLLRAAEVATARGALVRVIGDPRQLKAVGPGGGLQIVAEAAGSPELNELRRFQEPWEAEASLGLRRGEAAVLEDYRAHHRISGGLAEAVVEDTYRAWRASPGGPMANLMIASDNARVQALSLRARADRVASGQVEAGGVALHDGSLAGVGDVVVTRRNDRRLCTSANAGPAGFVRNRDRWQVAARGADGSLTVDHLTTGARVTLPPDYVATDVELSYAHTGHGAQGLTVDTAQVIVAPSDTAWFAYVAMTRGRVGNFARVVTDQVQEEPLGHHPRRDPVEVLAEVLARDEPTSATEHLRAAERQASDLFELTSRYREASRIELEARLHRALEARGATGLVEGPDAWQVHRAAGATEDAGHDVGAIVAALSPEALSDPASLVGAFYRARFGPAAEVTEPSWEEVGMHAGLVIRAGPQVAPDVGAYLDGLGAAMEARRAAMTAEITGRDPPPWAASLGPPPPAGEDREAWVAWVGQVAAWREAEGVAGPDLLGPAVAPGERANPGYV